MPQININPQSRPSEVTNVIWGHMQFPRNTDRAFELFAKLYLLQEGIETTLNTETVSLPAGWIKALVLGPSLQELKRGGSVRDRQGVSAGALLWAAFLYLQQPGAKVSLNKAIELVIRQVEGKDLVILGTKPYANKAELHKAWKEMRNVAHLWAGFFAVTLTINRGQLQPSTEALQSAMAIAQAFAHWGAACMVPGRTGSHVPLLDASELWQLPEYVQAIELKPMPLSSLPSFVTDPIGKRKR